jgi:hypothetical protein
MRGESMTNTQIVEAINRLPLSEKIHVIELVLKNIRQETERSQNLAEGAKALLEDYKNDEELTAWTALDGEDFYESR